VIRIRIIFKGKKIAIAREIGKEIKKKKKKKEKTNECIGRG
jgi:hypothetical protein